MSGPLIDLSHPIVDGMQTYPGLPGPIISEYLGRDDSEAHYAPGTRFHIGRIEMVANTGTYIDAPFHRFGGAVDIAGLPLLKIANLESVCIDVPGPNACVANLQDHAVTGRAVLLRTGWDRHWGSDAYARDYPFLTRAGAAWLVSQGAVLVGIDALNIDDNKDGERPAHTQLLQAGIPIVEHLRGLAQLPATGFRFFAVPCPVRDMGSFPVRAFALLDSAPGRPEKRAQ